MTAAVTTVRDDSGLFDCIRTMHDARVRRLPVVDSNGKPVGIISFGDLLGILSKEFGSLVENCTHPLEVGKSAKKGFAA
jgi:predicted transcriptional regulator